MEAELREKILAVITDACLRANGYDHGSVSICEVIADEAVWKIEEILPDLDDDDPPDFEKDGSKR